MPHHTFECPLRWADMDLLGHVNNVTYLDYVSEARQAFFAGLPAGRAPVTCHQVEFVLPLVFRRTPVLVDTWVTELTEDRITLAQEVYDAPVDGSSERTTYLRATTVLDHRPDEAERALALDARGPAPEWRPVAREARDFRDEWDLVVRRSDLDETGAARPGVYFEYFQEARIRYLMNLHTRGEKWSEHVVARTDVEYLAPVTYRPEPYTVRSWVAHLGSRSFTLCSTLCDGDRVLASAAVVMVTYDLETQGTTEMVPAQRARLQREISAG